MSQLPQLLLDKAEEIRLSSTTETAVELLKQAGFSDTDARASVDQHIMEKEATNILMESGVDIDTAVSMVKAAKVNLKDLVTYESGSSDVHPSVEYLQKAAEYIEALESQIEDLEKAASYQQVELPEQFTKAAASGVLTMEDILELQKMEQPLLNKLASAMDDAPWELGSGSGYMRPKTDALLEFMLS